SSPPPPLPTPFPSSSFVLQGSGETHFEDKLFRDGGVHGNRIPVLQNEQRGSGGQCRQHERPPADMPERATLRDAFTDPALPKDTLSLISPSLEPRGKTPRGGPTPTTACASWASSRAPRL
ncbi:unnamed protein product, partial [Laminaria digitata]